MIALGAGIHPQYPVDCGGEGRPPPNIRPRASETSDSGDDSPLFRRRPPPRPVDDVSLCTPTIVFDEGYPVISGFNFEKGPTGPWPG